MTGAAAAPDRFEREYGCTETEWLRWMPDATACPAPQRTSATSLRVAVAEGHLQLSWQALPPRVIALMRLPRLRVRFAFEGVANAPRADFMRRFDLHLQRGGG